jgi:hypothetical protein
MALVWVTVARSDGGGGGDAFFIDGNYVDIAGHLGTPIKLRTGSRLFEIFGPDDEIAWQARHICRRSRHNSETNPIVVILEPAAAEAAP